MPTLRIHLLGDFMILSGNTPVTAVNTPRLQSLLAYLLLHRRAPQPRNYLAFSFWPDSNEAHAQLSLRKLIHLLRNTLPEAETFLDINSRTLQWRSDAPFSLDVAEFEHDLGRAKESKHGADQAGQLTALRDAIEHYRGDLLPGFYDEWVLGERERLRQAFLEALERLIMLLEERIEYDLAIDYAQRLLRHDPLREESYRLLMRLFAVNGNRPSALRVYNRCVTLLQRELGVEPSPATQELYNSLRLPTPYSQLPLLSRTPRC